MPQNNVYKHVIVGIFTQPSYALDVQVLNITGYINIQHDGRMIVTFRDIGFQERCLSDIEKNSQVIE